MDDLISREAALNAIDGMKPMQGNMEQLVMKSLCWAAVKIIQPVDAVQVVRCRDCEYCHPIFCAPDGSPACDGSFSCGDTDIDYYAPSYHMDTYFCASGKRRNEDVSKD